MTTKEKQRIISLAYLITETKHSDYDLSNTLQRVLTKKIKQLLNA